MRGQSCTDVAAQVYDKYDKNQRIGIGIAGNAGRFAGACGNYKGMKIGNTVFECTTLPNGHMVEHDRVKAYLERLGNPMNVQRYRQSNNVYEIICNNPSYRTQEESTIAVIQKACSDPQYTNKRLLNANGTLKIPWGLVHPIDPDPKSVRTFQGVDYQRKTNPRSTFQKYARAYSIATRAYGTVGRERVDYDCVAVFTAGPNVAARGRSRGRSRMSATLRTFDYEAADDRKKFEKGVLDAIYAMLLEMRKRGVTIAIVPGISTGLYAGEYQTYILINYERLVNEAIDILYTTPQKMGSIKRVIYATTAPDAVQLV